MHNSFRWIVDPESPSLNEAVDLKDDFASVYRGRRYPTLLDLLAPAQQSSRRNLLQLQASELG